MKGSLICEVEFFGIGDRFHTGYYGASGTPGRFVKDDIRIKNKILDKLDSFQFPDQAGIRRFLYISLQGGAEFIDADNAIFGQECIVYDGRDHNTSRQLNGIIHDPQRGKILDKLDFIVIDDGEKKEIPLLFP